MVRSHQIDYCSTIAIAQGFLGAGRSWSARLCADRPLDFDRSANNM